MRQLEPRGVSLSPPPHRLLGFEAFGLPERVRVSPANDAAACRADVEPVNGYRRVLVLTDLSTASRAAIDTALAIGRSADVHLLHVIATAEEDRMRVLGSPAARIEQRRRARTARAAIRMHELVATLPGADRLIHVFGYGDVVPVVAVERAALRADLLVLGGAAGPSRRSRRLPGTARRLIAQCPCDVLALGAVC